MQIRASGGFKYSHEFKGMGDDPYVYTRDVGGVAGTPVIVNGNALSISIPHELLHKLNPKLSDITNEESNIMKYTYTTGTSLPKIPLRFKKVKVVTTGTGSENGTTEEQWTLIHP